MTMPAVELVGLSMRYKSYVALDSVTFSVPEGAFLSIVGPNGAGKSTLFRALLGLLSPSAGSVRVLGQTPRALPPGVVGYVPQVKTLDRSFPALSIELVVSGLRRKWPWRVSPAERDAAMAALEQVGAASLAERSIRELSGGQLQRIFLARCLAAKPKVLLLDEPGTGVDVLGKSDFYSVLEAYHAAERATILMVTHDWQAATYHSTHVLLLNRRVVSFGQPDHALSEASLRLAFGHEGHEHEHEHPHGHEHPPKDRSDA